MPTPAFNIVSPQFSFVNFNAVPAVEKCCMGDDDVCLPVINDNDIAFQFSIETDSIADADTVFATDLSQIQLILLDVSGVVIHNFTVTDSLQFEKYRTGTNQVTYLWRNPLNGLTSGATPLIQNDICFSFQISATVIFSGTSVNQTATSNCFIRKSGDCFTSVLEYYNDDDYADFEYCNVTNPINRIRLYLYVNQPQSKEDKAIYRKSNGVIKQTRSLITKEYVCWTENYTEDIHDKITVIFGHDNINIESSNYTGGLSKSSDYVIDWSDTFCKATATFKALATPYAVKNNNCADCDPVLLCTGRTVSSIGITDSLVSGIINYSASWINIGGIPEAGDIIEVSTDGIVWSTPAGLVMDSPTSCHFNTGSSTVTSFYIRITPSCGTGDNGIPVVFYYSTDYSSVFTTASITTDSFMINTAFAAGVTWDLSLDGGLTYTASGLTSTNYTVSGLTTGTTYSVVRRMHSISGIITVLAPVSVTTL